MAEQERKTFKWGDQEYLVDDLLALHRDYENNYYNFAKDEGQYDDASLGLLREDVSRRINAIKNGESFDSDGAHAGDKVNNVSIQTQKKGLFKKDKYVDQDINEWGKHYFSRLMKKMKPHQKKEEKDKGIWDINQHGFGAYLTGQGINARDIFEKYDLKDKDNPDNPRAFTQRDAELLKHLGGYKTWLASKGFDFTKNDNEWDDNHMATVESMITNSDWSDRAALAANLRKIGAGDQYTTSFTSDKWDLSKTNEQLDEEAKKRKEEENYKLKQQYLKNAQDEFLKNYEIGKGEYLTPINYSKHKFKEGVTPSFMDYYTDLSVSDRTKHGTYLGDDNQTWDNAYQSLMKSLREGTEYSDKNKGILLQRYFEDARNGFTDLGDGTWLVNESVGDTGTAYVYDPKSGYLQQRHLSEFANSNSNIKRAYEDLLYKHINNEYGTDYNTRTYVQFEMGGVLKAQLGAAVLSPYDVEDQYREKAAVNGLDTDVQKAKDEYMREKHKSDANPDAGWNAKHYARLGYAIADLGSAVAAFAPGAGTAVSAGLGLTSTFGNLFTDMSDKAVTAGETLRNFGMNLGMDALGLIPGGGAASKMGKIIRGLKTTVPLIIALPGVTQMLANSPEIAQSWKKAFDGSPENGGSKMTYQDYMNILQVLNVAAGATNIGRNVYKTAKKTTVKSDRIAIDVTDTRGNRKALVLEGDDVDNFKAANDEGKAQEFIDKIEGGHKYKINETTESNAGKFWGRDQNNKFHLFNQNPFGRRGTGKANILEIRSEKLTDFWGNPQTTKKETPKTRVYAKTGRQEADLTGRDLISTKGKENLDSWKATQQAAVEAPFTAWREKAAHYKARTDKAVELRDRVDADIQAKTAAKSNVEAQIASRQQTIDESSAEATRIQDWLDAGGVAAAKKTIKSARAKISKLKKSKTGKTPMQKRDINQRIAVLEADIAKARGELAANTPKAVLAAQNKASTANTEKSSLQVEINKLQSMLDNLTRRRDRLHTRATTHSAEYDAIKNFTPVKKTFNDVEYTFDVSPELKSLDGLFKQGGSINRNKINKFLNYAKG